MRSFRGGVRDPPLLEGVSTSRQARGVGTVVVLAPSPLRLAALGSGVLLPLFAPPPDRAQQPAPDGTPRCALSGRTFRSPTRSAHRSSPRHPAGFPTRRGRLRRIDSSLLSGPLLTLPFVALLLLRALPLVRIRVHPRADTCAQREGQSPATRENDGGPHAGALLSHSWTGRKRNPHPARAIFRGASPRGWPGLGTELPLREREQVEGFEPSWPHTSMPATSPTGS